jgi:peptide-methionine (S)-S-oxide reductase
VTGRSESATLGGGCFWCLEAAFQGLHGVRGVESGYAGGEVEHPTYEQVCTGTTGHAEVVRVEFDPEVLSFRELLEVFFVIHDPTTRDRQGADVGTQYRSVVFHHSEEQRQTAESLIQELEEISAFSDPIVTQREPVPEFYPAGEYHRDYYRRNPGQAYCQVVISPKLEKMRKAFAGRLRE